MPRLLFMTGKGGVGKSTLSALFALGLARRGEEVLLASLDPAHNQRDIFQQSFGDDAVAVAPGLRVLEADIRAWSERYLRDIERQVTESYRYLTALNLDRYFRVLRHSPGLDEYAMALAFRHIQREFGTADTIVLDMPPTALAVRFLAAPSVSLVWVDELIGVRKAIHERKEMITRVRFGSAEVESDHVLRRLEMERNRYLATEALFRDTSTTVAVLFNPDALSWEEARRIDEELEGLAFPRRLHVMNKCRDGMDEAGVPDTLRPFHRVAAAEAPLLGVDALRGFLDTHDVLPASV